MSAILLEADEIIVKPFEVRKFADLARGKLLTRRPAARLEKERVGMILRRLTDSDLATSEELSNSDQLFLPTSVIINTGDEHFRCLFQVSELSQLSEAFPFLVLQLRKEQFHEEDNVTSVDDRDGHVWNLRLGGFGTRRYGGQDAKVRRRFARDHVDAGQRHP